MLTDLVSQIQTDQLKPSSDKWKKSVEAVLATLQETLDQLKTEVVSERISTDDIYTSNISSTSIETDAFTSKTISADRVDTAMVDTDRVDATTGNIEKVTSDSISTRSISTQSLTLTDDLQANAIRGTSITVPTGNVTQLSSDHADVDDLVSQSISTTTIDTERVNSSESSLGDTKTDDLLVQGTLSTASIQTGDITSTGINTDKLTSPEVTVKQADIDVLSTRRQGYTGKLNVHPEQATVHDYYAIDFDYDHYVTYVGANYTGLNGQEHYWHVTLVGTKDTAIVSFDEDTLEVIKDISFDPDLGKVRIRFHATDYVYYYLHANGPDLEVLYNVDALQVPFVPKRTKGYTFQSYNDTTTEFYFGGEVFVHALSAEFQEFEDQVTKRLYVQHNIYFPLVMDDTGGVVEWGMGQEGQYITNRLTEPDEYGNQKLWANWESPDTYPQHTSHLITSEGVAVYTGEVEREEEIDGTIETIKEHPIVHIGDDSTVHGSIEVKKDITTKGVSLPHTSIYDSTKSDVEKVVGVNIVDGNMTRKTATDEHDSMWHGDVEDQKPVVYNADDDTFVTVDALKISDGEFLTLKADKAYIKELDTVKEETISTTANYITLRANNPSSLGTDTAGILINKYDGTHSLVLDTGSDGTLKVGTGTTVDTTYPTIVFEDNKWYVDDVEVNPVGALTSWGSVSTDDGKITYTDAVFSEVTLQSMQPILTRAEEADLSNLSLLIYDKATHKAISIPAPTKAEQILTTTIVDNKPVYSWIDKPAGVYVFDTMADYTNSTLDIPVGSMISIRSIKNYVTAEEV